MSLLIVLFKCISLFIELSVPLLSSSIFSGVISVFYVLLVINSIVFALGITVIIRVLRLRRNLSACVQLYWLGECAIAL